MAVGKLRGSLTRAGAVSLDDTSVTEWRDKNIFAFQCGEDVSLDDTSVTEWRKSFSVGIISKL